MHNPFLASATQIKKNIRQAGTEPGQAPAHKVHLDVVVAAGCLATGCKCHRSSERRGKLCATAAATPCPERRQWWQQQQSFLFLLPHGGGQSHYSLSSLATLEAMFLKPMEVPEMRLKRTPLSESRGSLHTSISHWTSESVLGSPWTHNSRNFSRCS